MEYPRVYGGDYVPISQLLAYHDVQDAPFCNAFRLRLRNAFYCEAEDYIAWDEHGLMLPLYKDAGEFAVAFVLAHEWGHAVEARARANLPANVFGELQADCFAGAYATWAEARALLRPGGTDAAIFAMYQRRDPAGTPWLSEDAHGSALDRIRAFSAGIDGGAELCAGYSLPSPDSTPPGLPPTAP